MEEEEGKVGPIFRDTRRYYCEYCGISRSKKSLLNSHLLAHHQEELAEREEAHEDEEERRIKSTTCQECGASFKKPAHLRQHMQSHSLERPYTCSVDDCHASYRRKDHLTRHLLQHKGKLFKCPIEYCKRKFTFQGNVKRHVTEFHSETSSSCEVDDLRQFACQEPGCGKLFRYHSKLRKHEKSHVKLDSVEAMCLEPGCFQQFSNEKCLRDHVQTCHQYITCEICGSKQSRRNINRHSQSHEPDSGPSKRIKCGCDGCSCTFLSRSNLNKHVKAVHLESRPFVCGFTGCGMRFSYKHVRDRHEKSGCHVYVPGNFEESDEQFTSRPRGGRKRKCPTMEMLVRKRVTAPFPDDECHSWFHSVENEES